MARSISAASMRANVATRSIASVDGMFAVATAKSADGLRTAVEGHRTYDPVRLRMTIRSIRFSSSRTLPANCRAAWRAGRPRTG